MEESNLNKDLAPQDENTDQSKKDSEGIDGKIGVKDGIVIITEEVNGGKSPSILPSRGILLQVNGNIINKGTQVRKDDLITWEITEKGKPWFSIEITNDKLSVYLTVNENIHKGYLIQDTSPVNQWLPKLVEGQIEYNIEEYSSMITEHLYKLGVKAQVKPSIIIQELTEPTFEKLLIAKGTPATQSTDGYIELKFSNELQEELKEEKGKVDYRNRIRIPSCSVGDVLAFIHPPKQGEEGIDIFGNPIIPKPAKTVEVRPNRKIKITEDGKVIAQERGRPSITGSVVKYFDIVDSFSVNSDVDMKTGHIYFNGDVVIQGNVQEQMRVEAMGNIYISGNTYNATIISAQNIHVKGTVINSQVISGQHGLFFSELYKIVEKLYRTIKLLKLSSIQMVKLLEQKGQEVDLGQIIAKLVETKYKSITVDMVKYNNIITEMENNKIEIPIQLKMIQRILKVFDNYHSMLKLNKDMIRSIKFSLKEVLVKSEASISVESEIKISDGNMSTIKTNGNIIVEKKGVIHCTLFAGKDIIFTDPKGVIRGGKVEAINEIKAGVVGSDLGSRPSVYAGERIYMEELIKAKVRVGHQTVKVNGPLSKVTFKYNSETEELVSDPPARMFS